MYKDCSFKLYVALKSTEYHNLFRQNRQRDSDMHETEDGGYFVVVDVLVILVMWSCGSCGHVVKWVKWVKCRAYIITLIFGGKALIIYEYYYMFLRG